MDANANIQRHACGTQAETHQGQGIETHQVTGETSVLGSGNVLDMHLLKTRHNFPGLNPDVIPLDVKLPAPVRA
jgi:hypothetical protein